MSPDLVQGGGELLVQHRTLHGYVVDHLGRLVLSGDLAPGEALPAEVELCAQLGVSRGALREAVKALVAKGMLVSRPRTGTRVRPRSSWNYLDADVLRWQEQSDPERLLRGVTELRSFIEPGAAQLAAVRASAGAIRSLEKAYDAMAAAGAHSEYEGFIEADVAFHMALLEACGNELFVSLGRAIEMALGSTFAVTGSVPGAIAATIPQHQEILHAIVSHDPDEAREAARRLIDSSRRDIETTTRVRRRGTPQQATGVR